MSSKQQKLRSNGHSESPLEIYDTIVEPTKRDEFLRETNLGLGNYTSKMYWQQVEAFKKHLYGEAAFGGGKLISRAKSDVKYQLAKEAWEDLDEDGRREAIEEYDGSRRRWFKAKGEDLWGEIGPNEEEIRALMESYGQDPRDPELREYYRTIVVHQELDRRTRIDGEFVTPFGRMIRARHEGSRSRNAHLIDAVTGRVKEFKGEAKEAAKRRLGRIRK